MSELISGKEALIAWYDGFEVEVNYAEKGWKLLRFPTYGVDVFKSANHTFRLKPRIITLNGIEVPAPFKPKHGEIFWHIDVREICSYNYKQEWSDSDEYLRLGAWRSEEEVKQVVAALRSVFKGD